MSTSHELFLAARDLIPGGVNSPVRSFKTVGGEPLFISRGRGPHIYDADGREYIDYVGSWGPMIVGHAHPQVISRVQQAAEHGLGFGAPSAVENELAALACELVPTAERIRMVNSGTEASMTAIRLARAYTGRDVVVKFEGCYHGHVDSLLVKAGSGALTLGVPGSPGVPEALAKLTTALPYNDAGAAEQAFAEIGDRVAAVIVEPIAGNMNCVPPRPGFLERLRELTHEAGALLIFDEVMTGFRVDPGGAQALFGIRPDLTVLGKIIGGGLPVGAVAGPARIMEQLAPTGPVYQAGTLAGNPLAMHAGVATLELLVRPGFHEALARTTEDLIAGLHEAARHAGIALATNHVTGMFGLFFTEDDEVTDFAGVMRSDQDRFARFFHGMLEEGVYLAPSPFEAGFVSAAHGEDEVERTVDAAARVLARIT